MIYLENTFSKNEAHSYVAYVGMDEKGPSEYGLTPGEAMEKIHNIIVEVLDSPSGLRPYVARIDGVSLSGIKSPS